jgi:Flp pilus assembly protein TadB
VNANGRDQRRADRILERRLRSRIILGGVTEEWQPNPRRVLWALPLTVVALIVLAALFGAQVAVWFVLIMVVVGVVVYALDRMSKRALK